MSLSNIILCYILKQQNLNRDLLFASEKSHTLFCDFLSDIHVHIDLFTHLGPTENVFTRSQ